MSDRDYIERTIATVRIHRGADNSWTQWANIFADEIEACWAELAARNDALREVRDVLDWIDAMPENPLQVQVRARAGIGLIDDALAREEQP